MAVKLSNTCRIAHALRDQESFYTPGGILGSPFSKDGDGPLPYLSQNLMAKVAYVVRSNTTPIGYRLKSGTWILPQTPEGSVSRINQDFLRRLITMGDAMRD